MYPSAFACLFLGKKVRKLKIVTSRTFDPVLGVMSGVWAYLITETRHPRPSGLSLPVLLQRKWNGDSVSTPTNPVVAAVKIPSPQISDAEDEGWAELQAELRKLEGK